MIFKKKRSDGYVDLSSQLAKEEAKRKRFIPQKTNSDGLVDLTGQLPESQNSNLKTNDSESASQSGGFFGFFGGSSTAAEVQSNQNSDTEDRKKKLTQRLLYLTNKLEEQEKEIYQMKQRIEVLERKSRVGY